MKVACGILAVGASAWVFDGCTGHTPPPHPSGVVVGCALSPSGKMILLRNGCTSCHSDDGTIVVGPSFRDLFGSTVTLLDGSTVVADEAYLTRSIAQPQVEIVAGFDNQMPAYSLTPGDLTNVVAYLRSVSRHTPHPAPPGTP